VATIGLIIAVAAAVAAGGNWLLLRRVRASTDHLVALHKTGARQAVNVAGLLSVEARRNQEDPPPAQRLTVIGTFDRRVIVNRRNFVQDRQANERIVIELPLGTTEVLPYITGFAFVFGEILEAGQDLFEAQIVDHHLGLQMANVFVEKIEPDSATLRVLSALSDINGDDRWASIIQIHGLFLGPA
jgi:hypothetical protein